MEKIVCPRVAACMAGNPAATLDAVRRVVACCRSKRTALAQLSLGPPDVAGGGCDDGAHTDTPPTQEPSSPNHSPGGETSCVVTTTTDETGRNSNSSGNVHLDFAVLANFTCGESISAAYVLAQLVRGKSQMRTTELLHPRDVQDARSQCPSLGCLCVLLTQGCLASGGFPKTLVAALEAWDEAAPTVLTVTMTGFEFPSSEVMRSSIVQQVAKMLSESEDRVGTIYRQLFSILACPFSPHGHISVLQVEVDGILRRMRSDSKRRLLPNKSNCNSETDVTRRTTSRSSGVFEASEHTPSHDF
jgi:hypothetical protein